MKIELEKSGKDKELQFINDKLAEAETEILRKSKAYDSLSDTHNELKAD